MILENQRSLILRQIYEYLLNCKFFSIDHFKQDYNVISQPNVSVNSKWVHPPGQPRAIPGKFF